MITFIKAGAPCLFSRAVTRIVCISAALLCANPSLAALNTPTHIESGLLVGVPALDASITVFNGIPFAAPPVGELRWRAPQAPPAWQGVRTAGQFGSACAQLARGAVSGSEDCLFLNVWTGAASAKERRPVFVWIHGGRFIFGAGSQPLFDGEGLARKGLVVVTFNYRLGVFGFLATPELSRESGHNASGNYGLLDQIAALQWVQKNIAAFGGDPQRVTIAGQSAGSGSVLQLVNSPLTRGLLHRAIAESGARYPNDPEISGLATSYRQLRGAEADGVRFAQEHGAASLKELRALTMEQLLAGNNANDEAYYGRPPLFRPVLDGWVIPRTYREAMASRAVNRVPVITGNNLDESGASPQPTIKLTDFTAAARKKYGPMFDEFIKLYPASTDAEAGQAQNASARDSSRVSSWLWADEWRRATGQSVYTYFWTHAPPGPDRERRGAYHESEINYIFNNLYATDRPWGDDDYRIADIMSSYWTNFATSGNPNGRQLSRWPVADGTPHVMQLGDEFGIMPVADAVKLDFWKRFFATQNAW